MWLNPIYGSPNDDNGDELGMTNISFETIEEYKDIAAINGYKKVLNSNGNIDAYMENLKFASRDNGRTPMQWNTTNHAGFTTGTSWLPANDNFTEINVESEENNINSVLSHFKKMTFLRKENPVLTYGLYTLIQPEHQEIYAYTREMEDSKMPVLLNFSEKDAGIALKDMGELSDKDILINNYDGIAIEDKVVLLRPCQGVIISLY